MAALARMRSGSSSVGILTPSALKVASIEVITCFTTLLSKCAHVGAVPECWARCAVTPVYKSGSLQSADNYRGIAIGTLPAKVYAAVIERRLTEYLEANNLRAQGQAGFRRNHRCADQMFILNSLITRARKNKSTLFTCFVDFRKAYDSVPRELLWRKLQAVGVSGGFLNAIKALYVSVPMCVSTNSGYTEDFHCTMGVKQGCPLSPTLFGVYLDDLEPHLLLSALSSTFDLPTVGPRLIPPLMYADDVALLATSVSGLQAQLSSVREYGIKWGLNVNVSKTKTVVFSTGAGPTPICSLTCGIEPVEQVSSFKYLGVQFHSRRGVLDAGVPRSETGAGQALAVRARLHELGLHDPALQVRLFDVLVRSGLLYGAELWAVDGLVRTQTEGDAVHMKYLRGVLGVRSAGTPNDSVLAEFGRYPLYIVAARLIVKFWNRLVNMDASRLLKIVFQHDLYQARIGSKFSWSYRVVSFLETVGLRIDMSVPSSIDIDRLMARLQDDHITRVNRSTGTKMLGYMERVGSFTGPEYTTASYLSTVRSVRARRHLAQFRLGSHWLQVDQGRFGRDRLPRDQRMCSRCSLSTVDDEFHMLFRCPAFSELRLKFSDLCWATEDVRRFLKQDDRRVALFISACAVLCGRGGTG